MTKATQAVCEVHAEANRVHSHAPSLQAVGLGVREAVGVSEKVQSFVAAVSKEIGGSKARSGAHLQALGEAVMTALAEVVKSGDNSGDDVSDTEVSSEAEVDGSTKGGKEEETRAAARAEAVKERLLAHRTDRTVETADRLLTPKLAGFSPQRGGKEQERLAAKKCEELPRSKQPARR